MSNSSSTLDEDIDYFMEFYPAMLKLHQGKSVAVHNSRILGYYDSELEAYLAGKKEFGNISFLVREINIEFMIYGRLGRPRDIRKLGQQSFHNIY